MDQQTSLPGFPKIFFADILPLHWESKSEINPIGDSTNSLRKLVVLVRNGASEVLLVIQ